MSHKKHNKEHERKHDRHVEPQERDTRKIDNKVYNKELAKLQIELVKLQEWICLKDGMPPAKAVLSKG